MSICVKWFSQIVCRQRVSVAQFVSNACLNVAQSVRLDTPRVRPTTQLFSSRLLPRRASSSELIAVRRFTAIFRRACIPRFFDISRVLSLVPGRFRWSPCGKGFFAWPSHFDFLSILEMGLVLETGKSALVVCNYGKISAKMRPPERRKGRK